MRDDVYMVLPINVNQYKYFIGIYNDTEFLVFSALTDEDFRLACEVSDYRYRIFIEPHRILLDSIAREFGIICESQISQHIRKYKLKQLLSVL